MVDKSNNLQLADKYFKEFLPSVTGNSSFAEKDNLNTVLSFSFSDIGIIWTLRIKKGQVVEIARDQADDNDVLFTLDSETFFQIVSGVLSPQESFFKNLSEIDGNIIKILKIGSILEKFTRQYPFKTP